MIKSNLAQAVDATNVKDKAAREQIILYGKSKGRAGLIPRKLFGCVYEILMFLCCFLVSIQSNCPYHSKCSFLFSKKGDQPQRADPLKLPFFLDFTGIKISQSISSAVRQTPCRV